MSDVTKQQTGTASQDAKRIISSEVVTNTGTGGTNKRVKTTNTSNNTNLPPPPSGLIRCQGCVGFGVGLVKDNGYCNHCTKTLGIQ